MHSVVDITDEESIMALVRDLKLQITPQSHRGLHRYSPHLKFVLRKRGDISTSTRCSLRGEHFRGRPTGKHLLPILPRKERAVFATLSARVGSISDNRLGGWYSYRASKAAQNMMVKRLRWRPADAGKSWYASRSTLAQ